MGRIDKSSEVFVDINKECLSYHDIDANKLIDYIVGVKVEDKLISNPIRIDEELFSTNSDISTPSITELLHNSPSYKTLCEYGFKVASITVPYGTLVKLLGSYISVDHDLAPINKEILVLDENNELTAKIIGRYYLPGSGYGYSIKETAITKYRQVYIIPKLEL